jgi:hypothetical protein
MPQWIDLAGRAEKELGGPVDVSILAAHAAE